MIALIVLRIGLPRMMQFTTNRDSKNTYSSNILIHATVAKCMHECNSSSDKMQPAAAAKDAHLKYNLSLTS